MLDSPERGRRANESTHGPMGVYESGEHQHPLGFHDFHRTECITVELWNCSQEPTGHLDVDNIKWLLGLIRLNMFLVSFAMWRTKALIQSDFFY